MRPRSALVGVLVVLAVATMVAGCSDNGAVPSGAATSASTAPAVVETPPPVIAPPAEPPVSTMTMDAAATTTTAKPLTADVVATELTSAERGIRDTSLSADAIAAFGRRQQRAYQLLSQHPELQAGVTALIPTDVSAALAFNTAARQAVVDHAAGSTPSAPSPTLPAWTIIEPRPIDELLADYQEAAAATGVPWEYLAAINLVETRMGRISGGSSAGALGPMQFLPATWSACCTGDIEDPRDAILGAAIYLASLGAPSEMHTALYGYNPNEGYVGAVTAYAANLMADPFAYGGSHAWEVYVSSAAGTVRLPVGYTAAAPIDAMQYVSTHPADAA